MNSDCKTEFKSLSLNLALEIHRVFNLIQTILNHKHVISLLFSDYLLAMHLATTISSRPHQQVQIQDQGKPVDRTNSEFAK